MATTDTPVHRHAPFNVIHAARVLTSFGALGAVLAGLAAVLVSLLLDLDIPHPRVYGLGIGVLLTVLMWIVHSVRARHNAADSSQRAERIVEKPAPRRGQKKSGKRAS